MIWRNLGLKWLAMRIANFSPSILDMKPQSSLGTLSGILASNWNGKHLRTGTVMNTKQKTKQKQKKCKGDFPDLASQTQTTQCCTHTQRLWATEAISNPLAEISFRVK